MIPTGMTAVLAQGWRPQMLLPALYLVAALLFAAVVIALARRWGRPPRAERLSPSEQLAHFRSLYEEGTISQEEFERLRSLLGGQLRQSLGIRHPRPAPPAEGRITPDPGGASRPSPGGEATDNPPPTGIRPA